MTAGPIVLGASNTFTGSVLIKRGSITLASNTGLGVSGNAVALGSAGFGSATLVTTGTSVSVANPITVASGTGGTLLLGSTNAGTTNSTFSNTLTLNDNLTVTSSKTGAGDVRFTGIINGVGSLTTVGTGEIQLGDGTNSVVNTYSGNTVVGGGTFVLADNAGLKFVIGASGVNNSISGTANQTLTLEGDFTFDLTGAATSGSWTIVNVGTVTETFGSTFQVLGGFTESANVWTKAVGPATYTFTEATGVLSAVVPEPGTFGLIGVGLMGMLVARRQKKSLV